MRKCDEKIEKTYSQKAFMLLQIHDELLFEAEENIAKEFAEDMKAIMESATPEISNFLVSIGIGKSWGDAK